MDRNVTQQLSNLFLVLGIIGIVSIIGNLFIIPVIAMFVVAIIILVKSKGLPIRKVAPILTLISAALMLIGFILAGGAIMSLILDAAANSLSIDADKVPQQAINPAQLGSLITAALLLLPAFVLNVIGTVFAFIDYTHLKQDALNADRSK